MNKHKELVTTTFVRDARKLIDNHAVESMMAGGYEHLSRDSYCGKDITLLGEKYGLDYKEVIDLLYKI